MAKPNKRCLILGGTAEARELAARANMLPGLEITTSIAGVTTDPAAPAGAVRTGGFGGVDGLADYLRNRSIDLMVDATHPFAAKISDNAVQAGKRADVGLIIVQRPAWPAERGDDWVHVLTTAEAAAAIKPGARVLITTGHKQVAPFLTRLDVASVIRTIEPLNMQLPANVQNITARPPFDLRQEEELFATQNIDTLVTKNSGGDLGYAKIEAARNLKLRVIMIDRPANAPLPDATSVDAAFEKITQALDLEPISAG